MSSFGPLLADTTSNGSDSKKLRVEDRVGDAPPSRVLHIRKLPNDVSETEIIALGLPFGKVTNILTLKGKNQVHGQAEMFSISLLSELVSVKRNLLFIVRLTVLSSSYLITEIIFVLGVSGAQHRGSCHDNGQLLLSCDATRP